MVSLAAVASDVVSLAICLVGFVYVYTLYISFKGGKYGKSFPYYLAATGVLCVELGAEVVLDLQSASPEIGEFSFHDAAIVVALILFVLGLRKSAEFWELKPGAPKPG